jgi:hypothetical protein
MRKCRVTCRPHINLRVVIGRSENELRSPVASRANVGDIGFALDQSLSTAKIAEDQPIRHRVHEDIVWFDIAMADVPLSDVPNRAKQLVRVNFDKDIRHALLLLDKRSIVGVQGFLVVLHDDMEVCFLAVVSLRKVSMFKT